MPRSNDYTESGIHVHDATFWIALSLVVFHCIYVSELNSVNQSIDFPIFNLGLFFVIRYEWLATACAISLLIGNLLKWGFLYMPYLHLMVYNNWKKYTFLVDIVIVLTLHFALKTTEQEALFRILVYKFVHYFINYFIGDQTFDVVLRNYRRYNPIKARRMLRNLRNN